MATDILAGTGASGFIRSLRALAPGTLSSAIAGATIFVIGAWMTLWAMVPDLLGAFGPIADGTAAILGHGSSSIASALVFDVAAVIGLRSLWRSGIRLSRETAAASGARRICLEQGPGLLTRARPGQSPFFAAGFEGIEKVETTAAYILAENIRKDAEHYRYEPIAMIIDRVAGRVTAGTSQLRDAQQIGLRLGILGTFFGMALALLQLNGVFSEDASTETSRVAIETIIEQLYLAFGTSIAGLVAAILLQIVAWGLRSREEAVLDLFQDVAVSIQNIYRSTEMGQSIGVNMDLLKDEIGEHRRDMASHKFIIGDYTNAMGNATKEASQVFEKPLDAIRQTGERLSTLLAEQDGAIKSLAETTRSVTSLQSQVAGHFETALTHAGELQREVFAGLRTELSALGAALRTDLRDGFHTDDRFNNARDLERSLLAATVALGDAVKDQRRMAHIHVVSVIIAFFANVTVAGALAWLIMQEPDRLMPPPPSEDSHVATTHAQ